MRRGPDFLCIGAQKAGTTWLHENLSQHPGLWLPPVKELHFLDHALPSLAKRIFSNASHHKLARRHVVDALAGRNGLTLALHIAFGQRGWDWYERLFANSWTRMGGEICPGYARMGDEQVAELARRYPRLKIIYLLRDPVDRAWSSVAMHFRKNGAGLVTDREQAEILSQLNKPKSFGHCEYSRNIGVWSRHFPERQFYFGFFDRIRENPQFYLSDILTFLGAEGDFTPRDATELVNSGKGERIPAVLEREIAALLLPETEELNRRFANTYTQRWLAHARKASA